MATFTLKKRFTFEAAHYLPHHDGKCRRLHGHSWVGWVEVEGEELAAQGPKTGMLVDYEDIARIVQEVVDRYLDHYCLNESLELKSPTSEHVARWIYHRLGERKLPVAAVTIEETCTSVCTYRPAAR
jgi:6-pyruvoyltetrahydropterin/6-carboxytetrahydropterin synthase